MRFILPLLFAAISSAHFLIDVPVSRFFDEELEPQAPCGGQPLGARTEFPIVGGQIKGLLLHPTATARFSIVISKTDPLASQFGQVLIGPGNNVQITEGDFTTNPIDLSGIPGVTNGASATIQVVMNTIDGVLYVCSDVTLVSSSGPPPTTAPPPPPPTTAVIVPPSSSSAVVVPPVTTAPGGGGGGGNDPQPATTDGSTGDNNQAITTTTDVNNIPIVVTSVVSGSVVLVTQNTSTTSARVITATTTATKSNTERNAIVLVTVFLSTLLFI
ncbi:UNVERIFIED_CONTAM: hypothetical protein HDU68_008367 [Siphonaria sp. JEL0065]|nr:hypothetical protein HDU68_008367 [Siphonaria sp. JEL0065]